MRKVMLLIGVLSMPLFLSGCYAATLAKMFTEHTCSLSDKEREALRENVDEATHPEKVRVQCAKDEIK